MQLKDIAHSRTGDKGNISVISVIAYNKDDYPFLLERITPERIAAFFSEIVHGEVIRYEVPSIGALNFELKAALDGGVTRSLAIDMHGKTLASALLEMEV